MDEGGREWNGVGRGENGELFSQAMSKRSRHYVPRLQCKSKKIPVSNHISTWPYDAMHSAVYFAALYL